MSSGAGGAVSPETGSPDPVSLENGERLSSAAVAALHAEHAINLQAFLWGVLRDKELAAEALQTTFQRLMEAGHTARSESIKGWLFKVAFHEARLLQRKQGVQHRVLRKYSTTPLQETGSPALQLISEEDVQQLRAALKELPAEQREVVERRIYREQTFAEIASELQLPLGTVLTRMRLAMEKLQRKLKPETT